LQGSLSVSDQGIINSFLSKMVALYRSTTEAGHYATQY